MLFNALLFIFEFSAEVWFGGWGSFIHPSHVRSFSVAGGCVEEAMQDDDDDNDDEGDGQAGKRANGKSAGEKTGGAPDQLIDDCELERVWKIPLTDPKTDRIIGLEWLEPSLCGHLNSFGGKAEEENRRKTRSQTQEAEDERNTVVSGWGGLLAARASDGAVFFLDARNQFSFDTEDPFEEKLEDAGDNEEDEDDKDDENDDEGREGETEDGSDDEESGQAEEEAAERRRAKKQPESGARSSSSSASAMSQLQPLFKTAPDAERMRLHPKTLRLGTTGKEHPVRIYDLTKPEEPIWIAKNVCFRFVFLSSFLFLFIHPLGLSCFFLCILFFSFLVVERFDDFFSSLCLSFSVLFDGCVVFFYCCRGCSGSDASAPPTTDQASLSEPPSSDLEQRFPFRLGKSEHHHDRKCLSQCESL